MRYRILIADDHQLVRQGLVVLLRQAEEFEVVGQAANGREAVELSRQLKPDVVIMDVSMPDLNGVEATRQVLAAVPGARVVALSAHGDPRTVGAALAAGASAYILKISAVDELQEAVRAVVRGERYLGPQLASQLARNGEDTLAMASSPLTPREREVLQLLAEGKAMKEAALALKVSIKTIETHRRSMMEKLALYSTAELTKYAIREGLTTVDL